MQSMSVSPQQVTMMAGEIRKGATGIRDELTTLEQKVGQLSAAWGGDAKESYAIAQRQWTQALGELQELLERIAGATEQISSGYVDTDNRAAQRFGA